MAYGLQHESDKVFWLVYDLGGGTFDAALINVRDGRINIVNHGGHNHLGGKNIDWEIVDQLLIPAVNRKYTLTDFHRRNPNPKWIAAIAKLKLKAEEAKIRLSTDESVEIFEEVLCRDDRGNPVCFEFELLRKDVEKIAEPYIVSSINICKKVMAEKDLNPGAIDRLILVGGPTLIPYLRERLSDPRHGLGIPLDFSHDPMTVVARGAALFAGTQRIPNKPDDPVSTGQYVVDLEYKPTGIDPEPPVGGRVLAPPGEDLAGFTVEFVNREARPGWRSGKIGLAPDGCFIASLWAEKGRPNTFAIELFNAVGVKVPVTPDSLTYRVVAVEMDDPPLLQSIGVALANNEVEFYFEKGITLPARRRKNLKTAFAIKQGQQGDLIKIPVVEGENRRADRNRLIGLLAIAPTSLQRDLPAGSEIEVTLEIDASRIIATKAFIPVLDEMYQDVISLKMKNTDPELLQKEIEFEKRRLARIREQAAPLEAPLTKQILRRIDEERMVHDVEAAFSAAATDRDAADKCEKRLLDLKLAVDAAEDAFEWPALTAEAEKEISEDEAIVARFNDEEDQKVLRVLARETRQAIESRDPDLLKRKVKDLDALYWRVCQKQPEYWLWALEQLKLRQTQLRDPARAKLLFAQSQRAVNNNDAPGLEAAVRQLVMLLPESEQEELQRGFGSIVVR